MAIIKFLELVQEDAGSLPIFKDDPNGAILCLEWEDGGSTHRAIVKKNDNNCFTRSFKIEVMRFIQPSGSDIWGFLNSYQRTANDTTYVNQLGQIVDPEEALQEVYDDDQPLYDDEDNLIGYALKIELKEGYYTEAQFFIDNVFKNIHQQPIALVNFFIQAIALKEGIQLN